MGDDPMSGDDIYRQIEEGIENDLDLPSDNFLIEVFDERVAIEGAVPSDRADEELERLLFETLDLDEVDYDVVVDEDLQSQDSPFVNEDPEDNYRGSEAGDPDLKDLSSSPRRQF